MQLIDQIAIATPHPRALIEALKIAGLTEWTEDEVVASGTVHGVEASNTARLFFNYQLGIEFEILCYDKGDNWHEHIPDRLDLNKPFLSHFGAHVSAEEMEVTKEQMEEYGINIAQEVITQSHTNPTIRDTRRYHYVIFDSRAILGYDLKLIERLPLRAEGVEGDGANS